mgnify:CR=1 FL=1
METGARGRLMSPARRCPDWRVGSVVEIDCRAPCRKPAMETGTGTRVDRRKERCPDLLPPLSLGKPRSPPRKPAMETGARGRLMSPARRCPDWRVGSVVEIDCRAPCRKPAMETGTGTRVDRRKERCPDLLPPLSLESQRSPPRKPAMETGADNRLIRGAEHCPDGSGPHEKYAQPRHRRDRGGGCHRMRGSGCRGWKGEQHVVVRLGEIFLVQRTPSSSSSMFMSASTMRRKVSSEQRM